MTPGIRTSPETLARTVVESRISRRYSSDLSTLNTLDRPYFFISYDCDLLGLLPAGKVDRLALEPLEWESVTVAEVMVPRGKLGTVTPETEVFTALVYMMERDLEVVLVVEDGQPVGCVTAARMGAALQEGPEGLIAAEGQPSRSSGREAA